MATENILMGDVVGSSKQIPRQLERHFRMLVGSCNEALARDLLSPYAVTLGDEFQGLPRSLTAMAESLLYLEEQRLRSDATYRLRYVALQGEISTDINTEKPYGMLGPGFKIARSLLTDRPRGSPRFVLRLKDGLAERQLQNLFLAYDGIVSRWPRRYWPLIIDMIEDPDNSRLARVHGKDRSQIYKLRRSKMIAEYRALKETIVSIAHATDQRGRSPAPSELTEFDQT